MSSTSSRLVGYWRVTAIEQGNEVYSDTVYPTLARAFIVLRDDETFMGSDVLNGITGRYIITPSGFRVLESSTTLRGYFGTDPAIILARRAMVAITDGHNVVANAMGDTLNIFLLDLEVRCERLPDSRHGANGPSGLAT